MHVSSLPEIKYFVSDISLARSLKGVSSHPNRDIVRRVEKFVLLVIKQVQKQDISRQNRLSFNQIKSD